MSRRKRLSTAVAAGLLTASLPAIPALAADVPTPVVAYEFDADDLTTGVVTDTSGNGLDGTLVNGSTAELVGGRDGGHAIQLPGGAPTSSGAYVTIPRKVLEGRTDLTVSARVKWDGTTAPWQWIYALGKDTSRYLFSTPYNGDGKLRTALTKDSAGAEAQVTGSAALPANAWKTLTVTLGGGRIVTYLDGAAVAEATTTATAADLLDASTTSAGFIGRSFYPDPLFDGAVDDFRVYGSALTADQVADEFGAAIPTVTALAQTSFEVRTTIGTAPALPASVIADFSDGYDRQVPVTWEAVDPAKYAQRGAFTVSGTAAGEPVTAGVTVIREGELTIDLATTTGDFHGGAAGTLYGLYADGVPSNNLIEGMNLRTVSTKAQDGPQHPGADALEVVKPLADSTGGDVYIYMTDIHRGFPYQWPGGTPEEKLATYREKIAQQVDQVLKLDKQYQDNIVFVPFNEPEGNMFGTGEWSYNGVSWLSDPGDYFAAWDDFYRLIKGKMPSARIAGPNTSILFEQVKGFLEHTVQAGTVPDVITWHELSHPEAVRDSVAKYRAWESEILPGKELPININEYAFNYHTSVPGQMIQWISAIEESKVDADIAYWNIDGNLSDSAVQANRGNGQWWLYNAYGQMSGQTVKVTPPYPGQNYTLQGVASLDKGKKQARAIFGGATSAGYIRFANVPRYFGKKVHAWIREIPWTGQVGDSAQPRLIAEKDVAVADGAVAFEFDRLDEASAYEIVISPAGESDRTAASPTTWQGSYEAEAATYTGGGYSKNGPEGSPRDVSKFYTSGAYNVGGLRTGSDGVLDFTVTAPSDGVYDLSVFANSLNTFDLVKEQGPTNVFLRVDGAAEQELFLPLGYKWVVWDHADTSVRLTAGEHTISLAARSLDGSKVTKGDVIIDRITLSLPNPAVTTDVYEAELAALDGGAKPVYAGRRTSGAGAAELGRGGGATFWVYSPRDATAVLDAGFTGSVNIDVNGIKVGGARKTAVSLSGGVNKIVVRGLSKHTTVDRLDVTTSAAPNRLGVAASGASAAVGLGGAASGAPAADGLGVPASGASAAAVDRLGGDASGALPATVVEAENAQLAGSAAVTAKSLASGGSAVTGVGGEPGNGNTLTFTVNAAKPGTYAMRVRYSNPEQAVATHYNPDPLARPADISVNGAPAKRFLFPHSFHDNNFWELTIPVTLKRGANTIAFSSEELPNFDGTTYASDTWPDVLLRSKFAPVIDKITVAPFSAPVR